MPAAQIGPEPRVPDETDQLGAPRHPEHPVGHRGMRGPLWARLRGRAEDSQRSLPPGPLRPPAVRLPVRPHGQQPVRRAAR